MNFYMVYLHSFIMQLGWICESVSAVLCSGNICYVVTTMTRIFIDFCFDDLGKNVETVLHKLNFF